MLQGSAGGCRLLEETHNYVGRDGQNSQTNEEQYSVHPFSPPIRMHGKIPHVSSLRDSPHRPNPTRHCRAGLQVVSSLRDYFVRHLAWAVSAEC